MQGEKDPGGLTASIMQAKDNSAPVSEEQNAAHVDVEAIMERIRAQVKQGLAGKKPRVPKFSSPAAQLMEGGASPILYSDELNYLNANWNTWTAEQEFTSHRPVIGPLIARVKKAFRDFLWQGILKNYFDAERQYQMQLVRHLNASARYIDARDAELFWQIMRKLDNDVKALNDRMDLLFDQASAAVAALESAQGAKLDELATGKNRTAEQTEQMQQNLVRHQQALAGLAASIEQIKEFELGLMTKSDRTDAVERQAARGSVWGAACAGMEEQLKDRCARHAEHFAGSPAMVVDLGCGGGTFLQALRSKGIEGCGVAFTTAAFELCREQGISVVLADAETYLKQLADSSIGGLFFLGALPGTVIINLAELVQLAAQKVKPGGKIVLDSGMQILAAGGSSASSSLRFPPPAELRLILERTGFKVLDQNGEEAQHPAGCLTPVDIPGYLAPQWQKILEQINGNITRLNGCLFGWDYYMVGEKQ